VSNLSPARITELLTKNETVFSEVALPGCIKSIECNQLASNCPIEDRLRVSSLFLPGDSEPTLILGVFDGHGGGTIADLVSKRLFSYIALSLLPEARNFQISSPEQLKSMLIDLHYTPKPRGDLDLDAKESKSLEIFRKTLPDRADIVSNLKASFISCDNDLSNEIQECLNDNGSGKDMLRFYLGAVVSGCCALVMVVHRGAAYIASAGDCRAVLGIQDKNAQDTNSEISSKDKRSVVGTKFTALELNDEHNCDNINEIRRLAASHPKSEQNTMIKHNRLLGHLMPFRAFGDFTYKWPAELIRACGITKVFGPDVIPSHYNTPPYLIAEPDVREVKIGRVDDHESKFLVMASDGLWEFFESSRDVIETIVDHNINACRDGSREEYDANCATHILRSALRANSSLDYGLNEEELRKLYHIRLESTLTLPQTIVRNFRDDISIIVLKLQ